MDVVKILKAVEIFNNHIKNSLVRKASLPPKSVQQIAHQINIGKLVWKSSYNSEKPDVNWGRAMIELSNIKNKSQSIFDEIVIFLSKETKPLKFQIFMREFEKWLSNDDGIEIPIPSQVQHM